DIPAGNDSEGIRMAIHPNGHALYYANGDDGFVLDTATNVSTALTAFWVGQMVSSPDGSRLYVAPGNNEIRVMDTATNTLAKVVQLPAWNIIAYSIGISPDGARVYVTDAVTGCIWEIDTATNTVLNPLPIANDPDYIALPPAASRLREYVASSGTNTVSVVDRATNR